MRELLLVNLGVNLIVDGIDADFALGFRLNLCKGYVYARCEHNINDPLHRRIARRAGMDMSHGIDHKNRNVLDCRRSNLRPATQSQNLQNAGLRCNNTSGIKGVHFDISRQKWMAYINVNHRRMQLGRFDSFEEAVAVRRAAAIQYHGQFARTDL